MSQLNPYLIFNGNAAEAMRFYEGALHGKLDLMTNAQSPAAEKAPPGNEERIMHGRLVFDGGVLMAMDGMAGQPYEGMHGFTVAIVYDKVPDAKRVFDALAEGGKVTMPWGKTFWAEGFGMLTDRFGTPWMINGQLTMQG